MNNILGIQIECQRRNCVTHIAMTNFIASFGESGSTSRLKNGS